MKKLLFALSTALIALTACGNDDATKETEQNTDASEETIQLVAGTAAEFPPFEFLDKGEVVGFDADLIAAIAEEAGFEIEMKNIGWDSLFPALGNGEIDLGASGITITEERLQTYDFTTPYFESTHMVVFKEGLQIETAQDIIGKKIGVQRGSSGAKAAEKIVSENDSSISNYDDMAVGFMALQNGDVDVIVTDSFVVDEFIKNNENSGFVAIEDPENFESEYYGFMFQKDSELVEKFNEALVAILENGKYEEVFKKWFPDSEPDVNELLKLAKND